MTTTTENPDSWTKVARTFPEKDRGPSRWQWRWHRVVAAIPVPVALQNGAGCYEAETINLLREVEERADAGDLAWLRRHGKVYEAIGAP